MKLNYFKAKLKMLYKFGISQLNSTFEFVASLIILLNITDF